MDGWMDGCVTDISAVTCVFMFVSVLEVVFMIIFVCVCVLTFTSCG